MSTSLPSRFSLLFRKPPRKILLQINWNIIATSKSPIELICDAHSGEDKANSGDVLCYPSTAKTTGGTNPTIKNKSENNLLADGVGLRLRREGVGGMSRLRHAGMCNDLTNSPTEGGLGQRPYLDTIQGFMTRHANASQGPLMIICYFCCRYFLAHTTGPDGFWLRKMLSHFRMEER